MLQIKKKIKVEKLVQFTVEANHDVHEAFDLNIH